VISRTPANGSAPKRSLARDLASVFHAVLGNGVLVTLVAVVLLALWYRDHRKGDPFEITANQALPPFTLIDQSMTNCAATPIMNDDGTPVVSDCAPVFGRRPSSRVAANGVLNPNALIPGSVEIRPDDVVVTLSVLDPHKRLAAGDLVALHVAEGEPDAGTPNATSAGRANSIRIGRAVVIQVGDAGADGMVPVAVAIGPEDEAAIGPLLGHEIAVPVYTVPDPTPEP
jgi:hypothetical protein